MKTEFVGEIVDFKDGKVTIEIDFLTPEMINDLNEAKLLKQSVKFSFSRRIRKTIQYYQLKFWYGFLAKVLQKLETPMNAETLDVLDEECKRSCLPAKTVIIGRKRMPFVPRKRDLSQEEMQLAIEKLKERYEYLNIDYSDLG